MLSEELGYLGVMAILTLYLTDHLSGCICLVRLRTPFTCSVGWIDHDIFFTFCQHMGMVVESCRLSVCLCPGLGAGGTSVLTLMTAFGLMMSIHTHRKMLSR